MRDVLNRTSMKPVESATAVADVTNQELVEKTK